MLEGRRRAASDDVQDNMRKVRDRRASGGESRDGLDEIEIAEVDIQEDIGVALIQMKTELLRQIEEALDQLRAGEYGYCLDCGADIPEKRLRALPFAVRCKPCEESREAYQEHRGRLFARREHCGGTPIALHVV